MRIEGTGRLDLPEPLLLERASQRAFDQADTLDEGRLLVPLGGLERPLEVVEHGEKLAHQPLVRMRNQALLIAGCALAVVLVVRLDALEVGEVLVPLRLGFGEMVRAGDDEPGDS